MRNCETCGKELIDDVRQNKKARASRRFCNHTCAGYVNASNPNWQGAITAGLKRRWSDPSFRKKAVERFTGEQNPNWRPLGSRLLTSSGRLPYWKVKVADSVWRWEHRVIAEAMIGRKLERTEHVHHVNGDTLDNREENLEVLDQATHHKITFEQYAHACPICGTLHMCKKR